MKSTLSGIFGILLLLVSGLPTAPCEAQGFLAQRLRNRLKQNMARLEQTPDCKRIKLAGLDLAIWEPDAKAHTEKLPIIIFSHGFHGNNTQSSFLMEDLAKAGYLVIAPNHKDAPASGGGFSKPDEKMTDASAWTDASHRDRREDIVKLIDALKKDPFWNSKIDWSKLALAGHSLGGYTVMGLAGAWPAWKIEGIKAVLALSPYCQPFAKHQTLKDMHVPIMYQSGTLDPGIAPFIRRPGGAFEQTTSPEEYVLFDRVHHFSFSNLNRNEEQKKLISHYSIAFLNKYVLDDSKANPQEKLAGVRQVLLK